jgi:uncharacterized protein (DUF2141 family)
MIKNWLACCVLFLCSLPLFAQNRVEVRVSNFDNNKGSCIVCLYDKASEFGDKGKPVMCGTVTIANKITRVVFDNITPGTYAVMAIHDANNNRKFDTNFLGIPKEGYGASKNKLPFAAAPKFDDNKFTVADGSQTECLIRLRYVF